MKKLDIPFGLPYPVGETPAKWIYSNIKWFLSVSVLLSLSPSARGLKKKRYADVVRGIYGSPRQRLARRRMYMHFWAFLRIAPRVYVPRMRTRVSPFFSARTRLYIHNTCEQTLLIRARPRNSASERPPSKSPGPRRLSPLRASFRILCVLREARRDKRGAR